MQGLGHMNVLMGSIVVVPVFQSTNTLAAGVSCWPTRIGTIVLSKHIWGSSKIPLLSSRFYPDHSMTLYLITPVVEWQLAPPKFQASNEYIALLVVVVVRARWVVTSGYSRGKWVVPAK